MRPQLYRAGFFPDTRTKQFQGCTNGIDGTTQIESIFLVKAWEFCGGSVGDLREATAVNTGSDHELLDTQGEIHRGLTV